jgi:hypothetical protein
MKDGDGLVEQESPVETIGSTPRPTEFFEQVLHDVKAEGGYATSTECDLYVVGLLSDAARSPTAIPEIEEPFGLRLHRAMCATGGERFERCRRLGDEVLFLSGFFAEHLETRGVELRYVASVGQRAYTGAATTLRFHAPGPQLFDELAESFPVFVTMLRHVADSLYALSARGETSVLELYERWQRTQSETLARALLDLGLLPTRGPREPN